MGSEAHLNHKIPALGLGAKDPGTVDSVPIDSYQFVGFASAYHFAALSHLKELVQGHGVALLLAQSAMEAKYPVGVERGDSFAFQPSDSVKLPETALLAVEALARQGAVHKQQEEA